MSFTNQMSNDTKERGYQLLLKRAENKVQGLGYSEKSGLFIRTLYHMTPLGRMTNPLMHALCWRLSGYHQGRSIADTGETRVA